MRFYSDTVCGTCGLNVWHSFDGYAPYGDTLDEAGMGGIGYSVAGFVKSKRCKEMYEWIKENKEIVFQSPVKKNRNSGRKFFFIVFKNKEA